MIPIKTAMIPVIVMTTTVAPMSSRRVDQDTLLSSWRASRKNSTVFANMFIFPLYRAHQPARPSHAGSPEQEQERQESNLQ